ncbi:MAG TPA: MFS transporter [Usitatibacter sp.]|nr:MFS transporter [Usitatibacter sp.]
MSSRPVSTAALVLFIAFACNMIGRGVADSFMVFVLPLSEEFGWTRARVSSVYSAFLVVTGLSAPLTGLLIDRFGARVIYPLGMLLLSIACLVASRLSELWQFQLCIGLTAGLAVSMLGMVPASMLISRWFRDRMSTAMGVAYAGFGTGTIVVVPLAQRSIELQGWRDTYTTIGLATLVALPLLLLLPWRRIAGDRMPKARTEAAPVATRAALANALRRREYWQIVQLFSFTSVTTFAVVTQLVPFLVQSGLSPLAAASAFGSAGLLSIFGIMTAGWSADRFGYRGAATASFVATFLGIVSLLAFSWHPAHWLVVAFVICFGSAMGARGPIVSSLAAKHFGGASFATIYGTMFACMSMSGAVSAFLTGWLYDVTGGYRAGLFFAMITVLVAVSPFWTSRPIAGPGKG